MKTNQKPKPYIVSFGLLTGDFDCTVRVEAQTAIEAAGIAWQSNPAQSKLKGRWPRVCQVIEIESLPTA